MAHAIEASKTALRFCRTHGPWVLEFPPSASNANAPHWAGRWALVAERGGWNRCVATERTPLGRLDGSRNRGVQNRTAVLSNPRSVGSRVPTLGLKCERPALGGALGISGGEGRVESLRRDGAHPIGAPRWLTQSRRPKPHCGFVEPTVRGFSSSHPRPQMRTPRTGRGVGH